MVLAPERPKRDIKLNKIEYLVFSIYEEYFGKILDKINPMSLKNNWKSLTGA